MDEAINSQDKEAYNRYLLEAVDAFGKAIKAEPLEAQYKIFLSKTYGDVGQIDMAETILDSVLERRPYSVSAYMLYGECEQEQNNNKKALNYYEKAVELTPTKAFPEVYSRMAQLYRKVGNTKKAAIYKTAARNNIPVRQ